eukprot:5290699-Heterocapsa_arctica.AAC.1
MHERVGGVHGAYAFLHLFRRALGIQHMTCIHEQPMFMKGPSPVLGPAPALVRFPWGPTPGL